MAFSGTAQRLLNCCTCEVYSLTSLNSRCVQLLARHSKWESTARDRWRKLFACAAQETTLLAAGFPCVDVSRQGLRQGMTGKVRAIMVLHGQGLVKVKRAAWQLPVNILCTHSVLGYRARRWCGSCSGFWRRRCRGSTPSRASSSRTCAVWILRARLAFDISVNMSFSVARDTHASAEQ